MFGSKPSQSAPHPGGTTVVLADDHRLMREGIRRILEGQTDLEIVGEAEDGHQALACIRTHRAQVAVVDLNMPGLSGVDLVRRIGRDHPHCAVLVLSMYEEELYAMRALKAGAHGYMTKDAAAEELVQAVRKVATGGCYLSRPMAERVVMALAHQDDTPPHERLSDREFEIFRCIVAGQRVSEISQALHLSVKTVSTHKSRILQKMQLDSAAALIRYGLEHRLFPDPGALGDPHHARERVPSGTRNLFGPHGVPAAQDSPATRAGQFTAVEDEPPSRGASSMAHTAVAQRPRPMQSRREESCGPFQGSLSF